MTLINQLSRIALISLLFPLFHFSSCGNSENKAEENPEKETQKEKVEESNLTDFEHGTWKIDSVAEINVVIDRLTDDSSIQVFNFRKGGVFSTMEVTSRTTKDMPIGTWQVKSDSIFILGETGTIAMRYQYKKLGPVLILNGNFPVSSNNKKKPSFYLSKYVPEYLKEIYGKKK